MLRSPYYKRYTLGDLEWLVIPPLLAGQFRIGEAKAGKDQEQPYPWPWYCGLLSRRKWTRS